MSEKVQFKAGDLVCIPHYSNKIFKLSDKPTGISMLYSFEDCKLFADIFPIVESGTVAEGGQVICHATQENYERLSATFTNIEFEPPPKRKEPKEVIKAMIKGGWKMIPCCDVNDDRENPPFGIHILSSSTFETVDTEKIIGKLIPFDPKTSLEIIDFIDGEVVLENEND